MHSYINNLGHITKMAAMPIYGKKNLLQNWWTDFKVCFGHSLMSFFFLFIYFFLAHLSRRLTGELIVYPCSVVRRRRPSSSFTISKIFSSETAWPIKAKLHVEHP